MAIPMKALPLLLATATSVKLSADVWSYAAHGADWNRGFCNPEFQIFVLRNLKFQMMSTIKLQHSKPICLLQGTDADAIYQSPIDLGQANLRRSEQLWYNFPRLGMPLTLYNNGHTISSTLPPSYKGGFGFGTLTNIEELQELFLLELYWVVCRLLSPMVRLLFAAF